MATARKIILWFLGIAIVVIAILYTIGVNVPRIEMWKVKKQGEIYEKQVQEELNKYKNDFDGGKTPEETLDLYIAALKAGDIEKASKYYEISLQDKELMRLKDKLQKNGNLSNRTDFFLDLKVNGEKKCNEENDGCVFEYFYTSTEDRTLEVEGMNQKVLIPAGEKSLISVSLGLNKYTGVWKISQ